MVCERLLHFSSDNQFFYSLPLFTFTTCMRNTVNFMVLIGYNCIFDDYHSQLHYSNHFVSYLTKFLQLLFIHQHFLKKFSHRSKYLHIGSWLNILVLRTLKIQLLPGYFFNIWLHISLQTFQNFN